MQRKMQLVHPGEILKMEVIDAHNLSITEASGLLDITRSNLSNILNGKTAISSEMALRIETVFGGNARLWSRLQAAYDLQVAEKISWKKEKELKNSR